MKKLLFVFLFLAACSHIHEGKVVSKYYVPAHSYTTFMMVGKIMVPQTHYISDRWYLVVDGKLNGEASTYDFSVTQEYYAEAKTGDRFIETE